MALLEILLGASLLAWCAIGVMGIWNHRATRVLTPGSLHEALPFTPRVSVLVPARNAERTLPAALNSLLKLDYPNYEVIVVDDDSTDQTPGIAEDFSRRFPEGERLKVIHNRDLPAGWTGKVHALSLAARAATGEWILATDADLVFHPAVLRVGITCAHEQAAHLVSLFPEFEYHSFWARVVLPAFSILLGIAFPLRLVNRAKSRRAIAAGAFILMRADDLRALGGYERLRSTVVEDLRIAEMFKRSGRRIYVALTRGLLRTAMYYNRGEVWEGLSRSAFEGAGCSVAKVLAGVAGAFTGVVLPWVAAFVLALRVAGLNQAQFHDPVLALAIANCVVSFLVYVPVLVFLRVPIPYAFTLPLATVFYSGVALHSALAITAGEGIRWKGRRYRPPA